MVPTEQGPLDLSVAASTGHDQLGRLGRRSSVMWEKGTLAVVDDERGVFRVVDEAPGREPTLWLLDRNRHWRAIRASRVHPVADGLPEEAAGRRSRRTDMQRPARTGR
jgi:hypothetical protein